MREMIIQPARGRARKIYPDFQNEDGTVKVMPASEWLAFPWEDVRLFMHFCPIYVLPTVELLESLKSLSAGYKTIEIGAGTGNIGRNLGIQMTDSYLQEDPRIAAYYMAAGQPTIRYPKDVVKCEAVAAARLTKAECVIGCYVTHWSTEGPGSSWGVKFERLLPMVRRLILVGNDKTHGANPIMKVFHKELSLPGKIITRAGADADQKIYVWGDTGNLCF